MGITRAWITPSAAIQGVVVGLLVSLLFAIVPLARCPSYQADPVAARGHAVHGAAARLAELAGRNRHRDSAGSRRHLAGRDRCKPGCSCRRASSASPIALTVASRLLVRADGPAREVATFRAASCRAQPGPAGQSDAGHPDGRRARLFLHSGRAGAAGEPARGVRRAARRRLAGSRARRRPARSGRRRPADCHAARDRAAALSAAHARARRRRRRPADSASRMPTPSGATAGSRASTASRSVTRSRPTNRFWPAQFWSSPLSTVAPRGEPDTEVSIVEEVQRDAQVEVGDVMRFDIAGQIVAARVTSIRKVEWDETQNGGFFFVLRPGAVDRARPAHLRRLRRDRRQSGRPRRAPARPRRRASRTSRRSTSPPSSTRFGPSSTTSRSGVTIVGAVTLIGGMLILVGAVAMTKFQRLYEAAIYRTLGASTRLVATMVAARVRRARPARRRARRRRRARALLGARALALRNRLAPGARAPVGRRR